MLHNYFRYNRNTRSITKKYDIKLKLFLEIMSELEVPKLKETETKGEQPANSSFIRCLDPETEQYLEEKENGENMEGYRKRWWYNVN